LSIKLHCFKINRLINNKVFFLILFFLSSINYSFSQNTHIDSLSNKLRKAYGYEKIDLLNSLAEYYIYANLPKALDYAQQALMGSKKYKYSNGIAKSYMNIGRIYDYMGDYSKGEDYYMKSISQNNKIGKYSNICNAYYCLGEIFVKKADFSKAYSCYIKGLQISERENDHNSQSYISNNIGFLYIILNDDEKAKTIFEKSLKNAIASKSIRRIIESYLGLAYFFQKRNDFVKMHYYLYKASKIIDKSKNMRVKINLYTHYGDYFLNIGDYIKAIDLYQQALMFSKSTNDKYDESIIYTRISHIYQLQKKYNLSLQYNIKALKIRKLARYDLLAGSSYTNIGSSYFLMNDYKNALKYFQMGLLIAKSLERKDYIQYNYKKLYELFIKQKKYIKALEYHILLMSSNNEINREEKDRKITEIQAKYEIEKKDQLMSKIVKEKEIQNLIHKRRQYFYSSVAIFFILTSVIILLFYKQSQLKNNQKNANIEQKLFRSQMNPHFIFNSLLSIQSYIFKNNSIKAASYLSSFAKLIRLVLINSREDFITLEKEIETIQLYLELQELRFKDKFQYSLSIDNEINKSLIAIPPMMIQPFIENSIEHGILNQNQMGKVDIRIVEKANSIQIEVEDNGIGIEKSKEIQKLNNMEHNPLGTKITVERILLLKKKYKMNVNLTIKNIKDKTNDKISGTLIILEVPIRKI